MHAGRFQTLKAVIDHYNTGANDSPTIEFLMQYNLQPGGLGLTAQEKADLVAFLKTLTDAEFFMEMRDRAGNRVARCFFNLCRMKIFIKNMVCARCIRTVERLFAGAGLPVKNVQLGEVETDAEPTSGQLLVLKNQLEAEGFDLLDDRALPPFRKKTAEPDSL